jgi:hypothetical protein
VEPACRLVRANGRKVASCGRTFLLLARYSTLCGIPCGRSSVPNRRCLQHSVVGTPLCARKKIRCSCRVLQHETKKMPALSLRELAIIDSAKVRCCSASCRLRWYFRAIRQRPPPLGSGIWHRAERSCRVGAWHRIVEAVHTGRHTPKGCMALPKRHTASHRCSRPLDRVGLRA